ncbi:aspartate/glutamate racemase family protein [Rhizomonospora bruguierae]|uniref:aspartate/glutamate racemase family protein n=1 Tax=Rhizomonospora bruguierae TaxID=1581705 RepID=UPI001BD06256|nr:aspartate/glutamate racemase family protein [Micromonospora sp. NBRC 107566]
MTPRVAFVISTYPAEEQRRREDAIMRHQRDGVELGIIRIPSRTYDGLGPDRLERLTPQFLDAFEQARAEGYDVAVPFGMYDLGADGGKSIMPVVGPCEAALHAAAMVGRRFGMICYTPDLKPALRRLIRSYGMERWVVAFESLGIEMNQLGPSAPAVREGLIATVSRMVQTHDVDVVIVMGVSMCPVIVPRLELEEAVGVPVVDGISAPIEMATCLFRLGLQPSRRQWPREGAQ